MNKLSNEKAAQALHDSADILRAVVAERDEAISKLATVERRREAEKLASVMHAKGLHQDVDSDVLADSLEKAAEQGRLPIIQEAVDMMGSHNMNFAQINNDEVNQGGGSSSLENFVMGHVG